MTKSLPADAITRIKTARYATCVEYADFLRAHRRTPKLFPAGEILVEPVGIHEGRA